MLSTTPRQRSPRSYARVLVGSVLAGALVLGSGASAASTAEIEAKGNARAAEMGTITSRSVQTTATTTILTYTGNFAEGMRPHGAPPPTGTRLTLVYVTATGFLTEVRLTGGDSSAHSATTLILRVLGNGGPPSKHNMRKPFPLNDNIVLIGGHRARTDASGRVVFHLRPGRYTVVVPDVNVKPCNRKLRVHGRRQHATIECGVL
jgi:hypothetical protein